MAILTLTGDYGYKDYWLRDASGTTITATNAEWDVAADDTAPAINIYDSDNVVINGGEIWGHVSQTAEWGSIYNHMATGFRVSDSANVTIRNFRIDGTWDGIRFVPDDSLNVANGSSNGWLVEDVYMHNIRDDAIENDFAHTGTLRDSLLDGVFSAFGTVNDQSAHGTLTVDDSIIIMKDYLKDGEMVHGSPFKFNTANPENNPDLKIFNSIIAVQDPSHNGMSRLREAWDHLTESSGNYYLNLSDTPFPSNYPLPPKGFTILQGEAARDFLASEKAKWLAEHGEAQAPTEPSPDPDPNLEQLSSGDFNGDGRDDILWRNDNGTVENWLGKSDGSFVDNGANTSINVSAHWQVAGFGDFNGDGRDDILWRQDNGTITDWLGQTNGGFVGNADDASVNVSAAWQVQGVGDFNGDGRDDILWRHDNGTITDWLGQADGGFVGNKGNVLTNVSATWQVQGVGDFNGDGRDDVLWRNDDGIVTNWLGTAKGGFVSNKANVLNDVSDGWHIQGVGDFNGDGRDDILWRHDDGTVTDWLGQADGGFASNGDDIAIKVGANLQVDAIGDFNGDGLDDLLWGSDSGDISQWLGQADGSFLGNPNANYDVATSWQVQSPDILWV